MGHVFLAGMMGSGKTTLAVALAEELGLNSFDLDEILTNRSSFMPQSNDAASWKDFRIREAAELEGFAFEPDAIIALGGGTLLSERAYELVHKLGTSIFLDVPLEELVHRVGVDPTRPLLSTCNNIKDVETVMARLMKERRPMYEKCNHTFRVEEGEPLQGTIMRLSDFIRRL